MTGEERASALAERLSALTPADDEWLTEALHHDVNCPCTLCKRFWSIVDPDGEYILPGEEPKVSS